MRRHRTVRLAGLVAGLALAVLLPAAVPAGPAAAAACSGPTGVSVVVTAPWGTSVGCAAGDPSSALAALQAAGHSAVMVQRFPAALCRIDGAPASDACVVMPPASAYWSLWTARRGGAWTFATTGVVSDNPPPGTVVGLAFGGGRPPTVAPPAAPAPRPTTPKPTTTKPTTARSAPPATAGSTTRAGSPASTSAAAQDGSAAPQPGAAAATGAAAGPSGATTALGAGQAAGPTTPATSTGALPLALGGGLVLSLGAATASVVRRRRS